MIVNLTDTVVVKTLNIDDGLACANLHALCSQSPWDTCSYKKLLETSKALGVFKGTNCLIGMILYQGTAEYIDILYFCVAPNHRRVGIGKLLLKDLISRWTCADIFVEVSRNNMPAIALYKLMNFMHVCTRKNYYKEKGSMIDAFVLKRSALDN